MFPSSPSDKSYVGPDNCASGRNNASCRFPVGITSLGDENQHIRIQLAVNKYNSSANNSLNNRCAVISPVRHSFLKNSLKAKDYEGETERMSKNEKKNGNQYEGVGAFPTIHLRKSAIRYRPIRRFNDVKIPYPELPVNRFLSHLPEVCPDLKSSPRSVLDVLEDLSGKKIHLKEDNGGNKSKAKGLGGEFFSNPNAVYKPLFVQKPKSSTVLTRDNTTQTLSPLGIETSTLQSNNSFMRNEASDPRAELRRKLAKQNNEIYASLSSSISSFALKRKRDKILPVKEDENSNDGLSAKKSKITNDQQKDVNENGVLKFMSWSKTNSINSTKLNRKNKLKESNSPTSPNKDRLTTIFLDMQNTNSKVQMFDGNLSSSVRKSLENNSQSSAKNGLKSKVDAPNLNGSLGTKTSENKEDESALKYSSSLGFAEKVTSLDSKKQENVQPNKPMFNTPNGKAEKIPNDLLKSASPTFQMGVNGSNTSNFSFSKTSEPLQIGNISNLSNTSLNKTIDGNDKEKKDNDCQVLDKPITSESSNDKPNFSSFKFGAEDNISPGGGSSSKDFKTPTSEANLKSVPTASSSPIRFAFPTTTSASTFPFQTSSVKVDDTKTEETSTSPAKPLFSFGKNNLPCELPTETVKLGEKNQMSNGLSSAAAVSAQNIQPVVFNFGQKSNADSSVNTVESQNLQNITSPTGQSNAGFLPSGTGLNDNTSTAAEKSKSLFTFGQKTETPATSTAQVTASEEQKFSFSFGKKSDPEQNKPQEGFDLKSSSLFAFGQKPASQESTQSVAVSTSVTSPSQVPIQDSAQNIVSNVTSQNQSASTQSSSLIGQALPTASAAPLAFSQTLTSQITNGFGAKSEASTLGTGNISAPAFNQSNSAFPAKTPLFGSTGGFGNATTQAAFSFGTSTSSASGFGFGAPATTQPTPTFGVSSAPQTGQTGSVFQTSTTSQSISGFGNSSTTQTTPAFGGSTLNPASTFGVSVTTQSPSTFGVSSTTQSAPTFGATSAAESITTFGTSTSSPSFGVPSTTQSTSAFGVSTQSPHTFGTSTGFGVSSSSQPDSLFGVAVSSPSAVRFGAITTQNNNGFGASPYFSTASSTLPNTSFGAPVATATSEFGTTQSSFTQPFGNKPISSLGPANSIFGQNLASTFSSNTGFSNDQNNLFGQKSSTEGSLFNQNKTQTPVFGGATQGFGAQNKPSFGISTSNVTGFSASPPNTTAAPVFNFGGSTTENTFAFGSNTSGSNNSQSAFAFKSPSNEPFKFGATTTKEGPGFGGTNTATFAFGSGQMNNNTIAEPKPTFNFGSAQVSSSGPFNFGTTPSPSVFSFGGSTSAGSGSSFSFGTPNPTPDAPFGQNPTPSPAGPFSVPGTFCIGSGSSQSRSRGTSRPRRRP